MNERLKKKYNVITILQQLCSVRGEKWTQEKTDIGVTRVVVDGEVFHIDAQGRVRSAEQLAQHEEEEARRIAQQHETRRQEIQAVLERGLVFDEIEYNGRLYEIEDGIVLDCGEAVKKEDKRIA